METIAQEQVVRISVGAWWIFENGHTANQQTVGGQQTLGDGEDIAAVGDFFLGGESGVCC